LKTQNYDKEFGHFIRKFDPEEEIRATMTLFRGHDVDQGRAVCCTQGSRRCCLIDTRYGLTDEEVLWTGLSAWATFQPRQVKRRQNPRRLFYPTESSHVFEKY
jgi:hypothetical protein